MASYVFRPNDPYPRRERQIFIASPVTSGTPIPRSIFKPDELIWIDGWVADRIARPEVWLDTWNQLLSLRGLAAQIESSRVANQRGWTYSSKFLAWVSVQHAVMTMTLLPANRPALAAEFRRHPFETELFKGNSFTASVVAGVLAESGGLPTARIPPSETFIHCAYCAQGFKQSEPRCTHCGAGHLSR